MNKYLKIFIVIILVVAVSTIISWKQNSNRYDESLLLETDTDVSLTPIPMLLELGSHKCSPCKAMMPILIELKKEYKNKFNVKYVDVWKDTEVATKYKINVIPTQIFFDANGKELFRHEGFLSKKAIIAQWNLLGITF